MEASINSDAGHNRGGSQDVGSVLSSSPITTGFSLEKELEELNRCSNVVLDDLIKPTSNLLDMVRI